MVFLFDSVCNNLQRTPLYAKSLISFRSRSLGAFATFMPKLLLPCVCVFVQVHSFSTEQDLLPDRIIKKKDPKDGIRELKKQIFVLQKALNKQKYLLFKPTKKKRRQDIVKRQEQKLFIEDLEFQLEILKQRLTEKKSSTKKKKTEKELAPSELINSLDLMNYDAKDLNLSKQQNLDIQSFLENFPNNKTLLTVSNSKILHPSKKYEFENIDFTLLLNEKFKKISSTEISNYVKEKALLLVKESKEYGSLFRKTKITSQLNDTQEKILNQLCFELKSNFTVEKKEQQQPYYETFRRILRLIKREQGLRKIKQNLPKPFLDLLSKDKKYKENKKIEVLVISTITSVLTAFQKIDRKSYLDLSILIGENLLINIYSDILLEKLDKIKKRTNKINVETQIKETLAYYQKVSNIQNPLKILFQLGNLMLIALIKVGLLEVFYQSEIIKEYEENLIWYRAFNSRQRADYLEDLNRPKPGTVVSLTNAMKELTKHMPEISFLYAYNTPSIIKPVEYDLDSKGNVNYGGFLSNELLQKYPLVKKDAQQRTLTPLKQEFLDARNYLQSSPFGISIDCLIFYLKTYQNNSFFSPKDDVVKRKQMTNILETCIHLLYRNKQNTFYSPISLDFRARTYFLNSLLQYQGPEFSRILFQTVEPYSVTKNTFEIIVSLLAIYYDKTNQFKSIKQHFAFFRKNIELIYKTAYSYSLNIDIKNKKYDFIKLCISLKTLNFFSSPHLILEQKTNLLISLDAKSSGLQLISLLCGSKSLAEKVNILQSENLDYKEDIYTFVSSKVHAFIDENIDEYLQKYPKFLFFDEHENRIFYDRKLWKRVIMIKGYAAGKDKLYSHFLIYLTNFSYIKPLWLQIKEVEIKLFFFELLSYVHRLLPEINNFLSLSFLISNDSFLQKKPLKWRTLNQTAEITHMYNDIEETQYVSSYNSIVMKLNVNLYKKDTLAKKNKWAFPANLVQSCDATLLECILLECKQQNIPIHGSAHDSILIRICDYTRIQDIISLVIKNLFTYNNVTAFWRQFRPYVKEEHLKLFDKKTQMDKETFEKLINDISKNKTLFVLS